MNITNAAVKTALFPTLLLALLASGACSTTTNVEAPRPAAVTITSPTAWVAPASLGNIANVASSSGQFSTLLTAATAAGLDATLSGMGPITVFAPTNAAFDKLPPATLQRLLRPENREALRQVVAYHVINGRVAAAGLAGKQMSSPTLEGSSLMIDGRGGVMVNGARVLQADIGASNGLIHSIDTVLMPPNMVPLR
jgi:uncharacterized surface protein with fasciclin (FAS1) repeats